VAHVDKIHSVTVGTTRIGARSREGLDEVEESLVTIATSCEGPTAGGVITFVLCATSVGNRLALVIGDDSLTSLIDKALAVGHCSAMLVGSLDHDSGITYWDNQ
jgi:hypothetical protein